MFCNYETLGLQFSLGFRDFWFSSRVFQLVSFFLSRVVLAFWGVFL